MSSRELLLGAVILAAGDARRFGAGRGGKLLADLDGTARSSSMSSMRSTRSVLV